MNIDDSGRHGGSARPTVSIVIPAWNEQDYLGECLDAIAAQTDPPDEVIVVDNGSTDDTHRIAVSYPFVTVLEEPVPGIVPARNRGLNAATGDVLARIDADSIVDPDWVAVVRAHFARAGAEEVAGITGSGDALIDGHPALGHLLGKATLEYGYYPISEMLTGGQVMVGCNMAITRAAWEAIREDAFPDHTKVHEDLDLSVLIHRADGHIHHLPEMRIRTRRVELEPPAKLWWRLRIWPNAVTRHRTPAMSMWSRRNRESRSGPKPRARIRRARKGRRRRPEGPTMALTDRCQHAGRRRSARLYGQVCLPTGTPW